MSKYYGINAQEALELSNNIKEFMREYYNTLYNTPPNKEHTPLKPHKPIVIDAKDYGFVPKKEKNE